MPFKTTVCAGQPVQFRSTSTEGDAAIAIFSWDFGDGTLGKGERPTHVYKSSGNYKVSLYIQDHNGCTSDTIITDYISVKARPVADYTFDKSFSCTKPVEVSFTNKTGGSGLSYFWLFGDGKNSTDRSPKHTYSDFGSYDHLLIVTSANGCRDTASVGTMDVRSLEMDFELIGKSLWPGYLSIQEHSHTGSN